MAGFLPEDWIDEVRSRNDIVNVISEYTILKPSGRGFFALCPFHNEKTASFHVYPEKQIYHCFGCGVGGDVFSFIMAIEGLDFIDSVKLLAERSGMSLPDTIDAQQAIRSKDTKDELYNINTEAARYYHAQLFSSQGRSALEYLKNRGLDMRTIRVFGLGYAPDSWSAAKDLLIKGGFSEQQLIQSGILVESKGKVYDRFRNRVMFPIIHPQGMVIGFGGRVLDDSLPKYLNSSDSLVFNKSNTLFGLNLAKKQRPLQNIIIVEGYMDVITLHQFGFRNAVASLGTSLTQGQAKLLRRYTREVLIAYDGDTAGQKATLRGLDILYKAGLTVKVMLFPKGADPDEVLRQYGAQYFKKLIDEATSFIDYKLDQLQKEYDLDSAEGKVEYATQAANILIEVDNLLERDIHIRRLETVTGFKSSLLYRQLEKLQSQRKDTQSGVKKQLNGNNRHIRGLQEHSMLVPSYLKAERHLICLMVQNVEIAKKIFSQLKDSDFELEIHREVASIVMQHIANNKEINEAQILAYTQDESKKREMVEIFTTEMEYDNIDKFIQDCINEVILYRIEKHRKQIQEEISQMDQSGVDDPDRYNLLLKELEMLNRKAKVSN